MYKQDKHQTKYSHHQTKYIGKQVGLRAYQHPCKGAVVVIYRCPIFADNLLRSRGASLIL